MPHSKRTLVDIAANPHLQLSPGNWSSDRYIYAAGGAISNPFEFAGARESLFRRQPCWTLPAWPAALQTAGDPLPWQPQVKPPRRAPAGRGAPRMPNAPGVSAAFQPGRHQRPFRFFHAVRSSNGCYVALGTLLKESAAQIEAGRVELASRKGTIRRTSESRPQETIQKGVVRVAPQAQLGRGLPLARAQYGVHQERSPNCVRADGRGIAFARRLIQHQTGQTSQE